MKKYFKEYNRNLNTNFARSIWNATNTRKSSTRAQLYTERKKQFHPLRISKTINQMMPTKNLSS
ncbi:MAG: hypothetical protein AAF849_08910 [Bacteroidota bacterium]